MSDLQTGHEQHQAGRGAVVTLSTPLLDQLGDAGTHELVRRVVALAAGDDEQRIAADLADTYERLGAPQPDAVVARMAENLAAADDLTVVTDDGRVLAGDQAFTPATAVPDVEGTEDPEHPDRPVYS